MKKKIMSIALVVCFVIALLSTGAVAVGAIAPTVSGKNISANGTPIKIVAGETAAYTNILYDKDADGNIEDTEYMDIIGTATSAGYDLSGYTIFGGGVSSLNLESTSVTICGGKIGSVYGGSSDGGNMNGGVYIEMNAGSVARLLACGWNGSVGGTGTTVSVAVHGGTIRGGTDQSVNLYSRNNAETTSLLIDGGTVSGRIAVKSTGAFVIKGGNILASIDGYAVPTDGTNSVYKTILTIKDGTTVKPNAAVSELVLDNGSYGMTDVKTNDNGQLYVYLPANTAVTAATVCGERYTGSVIAAAAGNAAGDLIKYVQIFLWTDDIAYDANAPFSGGTGAQAEPYLLSSAKDLAQLAVNVNNGTTYSGIYFKFTADIDLGGKYWVPIGYGTSLATAFSGYFDGGNNSVNNMNIIRSVCPGDTTFLGLFGWVYNRASVKNVGLTNAKLTVDVWSGHDVGLLIGYADSGVTVENCFAEGAINAIVTVRSIGGLIGQNYSGGSILNCYYRGNINSADGSRLGGIIGYLRTSSPKNCYVAATISSAASSKYAIAEAAENCYYDNTLNSTVTGGGGTGMSTADMKKLATARALDSSGLIWGCDEEISGGYPYLISTLNRGDIDIDGTVDVLDCMRAEQAVSGNVTPAESKLPRYDMNGDGNIAIEDYGLIVNKAVGSI